jgi:hypothetical protein
MNHVERLKALVSECPLTMDIAYSEDVDEFLMRCSVNGVVLWIATVPEEVLIQIMGEPSEIEMSLVEERVKFYDNPEA